MQTVHRFCQRTKWKSLASKIRALRCLDGRYYITYVAVSRHGPATALASTTDFKTFERHGIIFCPENKDVVLLPERVDGKYVALHRPLGDMPFCRPEMWIARSPDLVHWGRTGIFLVEPAIGRMAASAPVLRRSRLPEGWLEIYHGNRRPEIVGEVGAIAAAPCCWRKTIRVASLKSAENRFLNRNLILKTKDLWRKSCFRPACLKKTTGY